MTRTALFDDHPEFANGELHVVLAYGVFEYNPEFDPAKARRRWPPITEDGEDVSRDLQLELMWLAWI